MKFIEITKLGYRYPSLGFSSLTAYLESQEETLEWYQWLMEHNGTLREGTILEFPDEQTRTMFLMKFQE